MSEQEFDWKNGAVLKEHSKRKHKILKEYLAEYLRVRCQLPQMERFRLAIVDGFAGAGRYQCGASGSPVLMLEVLKTTCSEINIIRAAENKRPIQFDVLLIVNDAKPGVIEMCLENLAPVHAAIKDGCERLNVTVKSFAQDFETVYPEIKRMIDSSGYHSSVLFNLDQCGHSKVELATLTDILRSYPASEVFLTFAINAFVSFLPKRDQAELSRRLQHVGVDVKSLGEMDECSTDQAWLGAVEYTVFEAFKNFGAYTSPFSINNPSGWRFWLIHFANNYRARQVYNNILHENSSSQAHFGRSGLHMLSYDPREEGQLYLFEQEHRNNAVLQLHDDIPRALAHFGDAIEMGDFYQSVYNETPAHSDDIHKAIIENSDLEVLTPKGGERRVANTISKGDILKLKTQRSFFTVLFPQGKPEK